MKTTNNFKTNKLFMLGILAVLTFFVACKKEDKVTIPTSTTNPATTTQIDYLTKATWKRYSLRSKKGNDPWIDITSIQASCNMDNTQTFLKNNTGFHDEGATKCDPSYPQTQNFTWSIDNNGSILNMGFGVEYNIEVLDSTTLKIISAVGSDLTEWTYEH